MLDFFDQTFQEKPLNNSQFGLCDNEDGTAAFTDTMNKDKWIATVENPNGLTLVFTAIDKGVIKDDEYPGNERCDGMLTSDNHLYLIFVELKNERGEWVQKGISQLESTIKLFDDTYPEKKKQYTYKKAYVCNKKHPHFQEIDNEQNLKFFRAYRFRLDIQAKILLAM
jgi:hypothetical protein